MSEEVFSVEGDGEVGALGDDFQKVFFGNVKACLPTFEFLPG